MPIPKIPDKPHHDISERELEMLKPSWLVEVSNWRELGEAIATFNKFIGNFNFTGVAEMVTENNETRLEIKLFWDHHDVYRCDVCSKIPDKADGFNPVICNFCGQKVCNGCWKAHDLSHWRNNGKPKTDDIPF